VQVDVRPAEREELAAAQPRVKRQEDQRAQVIGALCQRIPQAVLLGKGQKPHALGVIDLEALQAPQRVRLDHVPLDGLLERRAQRVELPIQRDGLDPAFRRSRRQDSRRQVLNVVSG